MFDRILNAIQHNNSHYLHQTLATFLRMYGDILRNVWRHSWECLAIFPGIFEDIPRNIWRYSAECFRIFPRIFGNIPQNFWRESPEYNIPPIPRVPHILFPVPIFLVFYIVKTYMWNKTEETMFPHIALFYFSSFDVLALLKMKCNKTVWSDTKKFLTLCSYHVKYAF